MPAEQKPDLSHNSVGCQKDKIHELAETADTEYYIASITTYRDRKKRGLDRIRFVIAELEKIKNITTCKQCLHDISFQLDLQVKAVNELETGKESFIGFK